MSWAASAMPASGGPLTSRLWRRLSQPWRAAQGAYLSLPASWTLQADGQCEALPEVLAAFEAWCAVHPGSRCELAVGAAASLWCGVGMARATPDALAAAWDQALQQWAHYLDVDLRAPGVLSAWQLQEACAPGLAVLSATPVALTQGLLTVAAGHDVRIDWMGPWWARGLALWMQQQPRAQNDGDADARQLALAEPDWTWLATVQPQATAPRPWLGLDTQTLASPWGAKSGLALTQLALHQGLQPGLQHGAPASPASPLRFALQPEGLTPGQAQCLDVPIDTLSGQGAMWTQA